MNVYYCDVSSFVNNNALFEESQSYYLGLIDSERLEKMSRYKFVSDKVRSVAAGILVQVALKDHIQQKVYSGSEEIKLNLCDILQPEEVLQLHYSPNAYGKPFIMAYPNFHFSISHSGDYVCLACHNDKIGMDIQEERGPKTMAISARFFAPKERELLEAATDKESREHMFYRIWSAKEAYIKYTGRGISENLASFTIDLEGKIVKDTDTNATTGYLYEPLTLIKNSSAICIGQEVSELYTIKVNL